MLWTPTLLFLQAVCGAIINAVASASAGVLEAAYLGLCVAPTPAPTPQLLMAGVTEPVYDTYARQLIIWYPSYMALLGPQTLQGESLAFTPTDTTDSVSITGCFIASALTAGKLWMLTLFPTPIPLSSPETSLIIEPQVSFQFLSIYGGPIKQS